MRNITAGVSILTSFTMTLCVSQLMSQALTKAQRSTCDDHSIPLKYCEDLAGITLTLNKTELEEPNSDPKALSTFLAPLVLREAIIEKLQSDVQQVSTGGNVNQAGNSGTNTGSTNLVTKPTTTDLLSLASETGAFTDTVNGSSATIQANALGLVKYLNGVPVFRYWDATGADILQHLNFNATLGITQTGSTTTRSAGSATNTSLAALASLFIPTNNATLSSFGATYAILRKFNPQSKKSMTAWNNAVKVNQAKIQTDNNAVKAAIDKFVPKHFSSSVPITTALDEWNKAVLAALAQPASAQQFEALATAYEIYLNAYEKALMAQTDALAKADAFINAESTIQDAIYKLVDQARGTPIATFGYTYTPSAQKPATHSFTGSVAYAFYGDPKKTSMLHLSGAQLTGNFTAVVFAKVPTGASYGRLQDYQASGEFDLPIGRNTLKPIATFSVAGYGQYQYKPTVLNVSGANLLPGTNIALPANAQSYLGTAGWLEVAQGKIVVNLKQGLSIPLAVKWSNKTDLLQANEVRGQIGISYDLSALSSLIKGGG